MEIIESQAGFLGLVVVAVILIIGAGWYILYQMKKSRHQRHIKKVLKSLGVKYLRDIVLPDGIEGLVFIDYLLLVPNGVVILDINMSEGYLFGGESVDQWSQVINNKTYKFDNPLYANQTRCQAVLWNIENNFETGSDKSKTEWQVYGWIVFSNAGNFPKGIPDQVSMIDDLKDNLEKELKLADPVSEATLNIWDQLHNLSITTRAEVKH